MDGRRLRFLAFSLIDLAAYLTHRRHLPRLGYTLATWRCVQGAEADTRSRAATMNQSVHSGVRVRVVASEKPRNHVTITRTGDVAERGGIIVHLIGTTGRSPQLVAGARAASSVVCSKFRRTGPVRRCGVPGLG